MTNAVSGLDPTTLEEATRLEEQTRFQLESLGYDEKLVGVAISRARGTALFRVGPLDPDIKGRAFLNWLQEELQSCEAWCGNTKAFLDGNGTPDEED